MSEDEKERPLEERVAEARKALKGSESDIIAYIVGEPVEKVLKLERPYYISATLDRDDPRGLIRLDLKSSSFRTGWYSIEEARTLARDLEAAAAWIERMLAAAQADAAPAPDLSDSLE